MPLRAPRVVYLVAGKCQRTFEGLVRHPPVAAVDILVAVTVLQKDAQTLGLELPHERMNAVATA